MTWNVGFYLNGRKKSPVKEFISKQPVKMAAKIVHLLELLQKFGPFLTEPYCKRLTNNLYELRVRGKSAIRILYTKSSDQFILVHVFVKKTQKTPRKEIDIALDRIKLLL